MGGQADSPMLGQEEEGSRKLWQRQRRRRSSSAAFPTRWSDDNRTQETLDEREKAVVVRRAQKMERVGVFACVRAPCETNVTSCPPDVRSSTSSGFVPQPCRFAFSLAHGGAAPASRIDELPNSLAFILATDVAALARAELVIILPQRCIQIEGQAKEPPAWDGRYCGNNRFSYRSPHGRGRERRG
jgi:hypothetical protein